MLDKYKIKPKKSIFTIYKIPFSKIERANISLKDKDKSYSLEKHCREQKWDIGINAAMFDMKTYQNVTDLIVKGKVNNGGNYCDVGIAFGNDFSNIGAYKSTTSNSKGKPVDFIGGAPTLIVDGKIHMNMKGIGKYFATKFTQRTAIGVDKSSIYILSTKKNKANLYDVANELLAHGCIDAIDLDGGGSTAIKAGDDYFTQGRNIPTAFGIKLKNMIPKTSNSPVKVCIDAGHCKLTPGKRSFDNSFFEYEFNLDVANRIKKHLDRHGVESYVQHIENANPSTELNARIKAINKEKPTLVVSIHANAYGTTWNSANGWEAYCYNPSEKNSKGTKLAAAIQKNSIGLLEIRDRGIKNARGVAGIVMKTTPPVVLVEHGFYTNKSELYKLKHNGYREACSIGDAKGILEYLGIKWEEEKKEQTKTLYKVQVGAFSKKENAENLKKELEQKGYKPFIVKN